MRRIVPIALIVCAFTTVQALEGTWKASSEDRPDGRLYLGLTFGRTSKMGAMYDLETLAGLSAAQIAAPGPTPVRFAIDREAGRVDLEGSFRAGRGAGHFTFVPRPEYLDAVRALGVQDSQRARGRREHRASRDETLLTLALLDVSTDYIRSMIAEGFRVSLEEYQEMRIFDVTPAYVRTMRGLGLGDLSADDLVATRIHGVTPEYVREMRSEGWDLALDDLLSARIHGVTPQFRNEMEKLGYALSIEDLTAFRIHGVTPAWIAELKGIGYTRVSADDLVAARIHGVTAEFIRSLQDAGYRNLSMSELISMRIHGIGAKELSRRRSI